MISTIIRYAILAMSILLGSLPAGCTGWWCSTVAQQQDLNICDSHANVNPIHTIHPSNPR